MDLTEEQVVARRTYQREYARARRADPAFRRREQDRENARRAASGTRAEVARAYRATPAGRAAKRRENAKYKASPRGRLIGRALASARRDWQGAGTATSADVLAVFERAGGRCCYCLRIVGDSLLDLEHVVPRALGGLHEADNLAAACQDCNRGPGGKFANDPWVWITATGSATPDSPALRRYPRTT